MGLFLCLNGSDLCVVCSDAEGWDPGRSLRDMKKGMGWIIWEEKDWCQVFGEACVEVEEVAPGREPKGNGYIGSCSSAREAA